MPNTLNLKIIKKADDPVGITRVSLGMGLDPDGHTFAYCVYRGTKEETEKCLGLVLKSIQAMITLLGDKEPDVEPDDGKQYA